MANDSTEQKSRNKKSSSSTRSNTGANKDGPTHKNCNENTSLRPNSGERIAGKSVSNDGSAILKFGSMLAASIKELKDTMAVMFDQLEHILTRPDIWVLDTEAMMPRKTTQTTIVVVLPRGRACSDEDVIFQAPSYAIIFLFLLFVYGVFSCLCTSKKKIQSQHNLQSLGCVTCRKTSQTVQLPRHDKSRRRRSSNGRFEPIGRRRREIRPSPSKIMELGFENGGF